MVDKCYDWTGLTGQNARASKRENIEVLRESANCLSGMLT